MKSIRSTATRLGTAVALAALACTFPGAASAQLTSDACVSLNVRPCPVWGEFGTGLSVQDMIETMTIAGPVINAQSQQNRHGLFQQRAGRAVIFTFADGRYFGETVYVGMYDARNPSNRFIVMAGGITLPGDQAVVRILPNGDVMLNGVLAATNFGNCFGLYMNVFGGTPRSGGSGNPRVLDWVHHSEDPLNEGGLPQMVTYRGRNKCVFAIPGVAPFVFAPDQFLFGMEVQPLDPGINPATGLPFLPADRDYNEVVLVMSGVKTFRQPGFLKEVTLSTN